MADIAYSFATALELVSLALKAIPVQVVAGKIDATTAYEAGQAFNDLKSLIEKYPQNTPGEKEAIWEKTFSLLKFMQEHEGPLSRDQKKLLIDTELRFRILIT